jgi:hypothetical protein
MTYSLEYQQALQMQHAGEDTWGKGKPKFAGADLLGLLKSRPYIRTVLDFGCGKGMLGSWLADIAPEIEYTGYDPGNPELDTLPKGQFDLVMSCDVLEHVEEDHINPTIQQMWDYTRVVMYNNIACSPARGRFSGDTKWQGQDLHLSVYTPEEWQRRFGAVLGHDSKFSPYEWRHVTRRWHSDMRPRCVMIDERLG